MLPSLLIVFGRVLVCLLTLHYGPCHLPGLGAGLVVLEALLAQVLGKVKLATLHNMGVTR